jgi:hypothetical protein
MHDSPIFEKDECTGQLIKWEAGSVWDTYAYQQHELSTTTWNLIGFEGANYIRLRAHNCKIILADEEERNLRTCASCQRLANSRELRKFMDRAKGNAPPRTPWRFLNSNQLTQLLIAARKKTKTYESHIRNQKRKIGTLQRKFSDHKRNIMLLAQNKIAGVSRILQVALRRGVSAKEITKRLERAIDGTYRPQGGWSEREINVAFLIKALGGPRLLYAMQKEEAYPSLSTLRRRKFVPELIISNRTPDAPELTSNFTAFLGDKGRQPPENKDIGQVLMIDGIALEEVCRFDQEQNRIVGLCREHSAKIKTTCDTIEDIDRISNGLNSKTLHHGKDGTVVGIAPVTGNENYYVLPLVLSGSCKADSGKELAKWVNRFTELYDNSPDGRIRHGPISALATDGESSFRNLRFELCTLRDLDRSLLYAAVLYKLTGLNIRTGNNTLLGTSDPKHIIKRFATKLRSPTGIQVADKRIFPSDVFSALTQLPGMTEKKAELLLNPADKQNVPKAVNLLQSLSDLNPKEVSGTPAVVETLSRISFVSKVLNYFVNPFIKVQYTLSQQIRELSTYSHLLTSIYRRHRTGFITSALFADSQAIVKNILFTVARLQSIDGQIQYYILFEGTDRLEGVFSSARTQDHARNFDILQLSHKLSIGAEINAIFERYPNLNRGHLRRNLVNARGVDHINPKSWVGDVHVGNVDIEKEYFAGRDEANKILVAEFGMSWSTNWDELFSKLNVDHLRPIEGDGYISWNSSDPSDEDDDLGIITGNLSSLSNSEPAEEDTDPSNFSDAREDVDLNALNDLDFFPEQLNPSQEKNPKHYLIVDGIKQHKSAVVAARLASDRARKVTTRPLRAQGVTVEESVGRKFRIWEDSIDGDVTDDLVKSGDLGGFLTRVGQSICLAVGEVLNFRQGNNRTNLVSVKFDDLDATGTKEISVAVQILELVPYTDENNNLSWSWPRKYVKIQSTRGNTITERNFATRIPGSIFLPLGPSIVADRSQNKTWSFQHEELQTVLEEAWEALRPETDEIIDNLELLPMVMSSETFPYCPDASLAPPYLYNMPNSSGNGESESLPSGDVQASIGRNDKIPCKLCNHDFILADMRNHVGKHILRAHRGEPDPSLPENLDIGINPCGWCGLDGCKTQLNTTGQGTKRTTSNCTYHYAKMQYRAAEISTPRKPCTNLPIHCPICPSRLNGQPQTFWKYNLIHHMTEYHLTDSGELPPFPREIVKITRISKAEENALGVDEGLTTSHREQYGIPDSENLLEAVDVEERASRKRAVSSVSQASTSSR